MHTPHRGPPDLSQDSRSPSIYLDVSDTGSRSTCWSGPPSRRSSSFSTSPPSVGQFPNPRNRGRDDLRVDRFRIGHPTIHARANRGGPKSDSSSTCPAPSCVFLFGKTEILKSSNGFVNPEGRPAKIVKP